MDALVSNIISEDNITIAIVVTNPALPTITPIRKKRITPNIIVTFGTKIPRNVPYFLSSVI
ncbi:hypothetical protein Megvenef_01249 [Candidatus Megaera venefica]|uniref:Uncharacterized protein n=1 Tax=Candidatus Megaera venefica TaxID=2055910 RepID=A0ABU5NDN6_9RICK|nr:hypothetical protein [Candidatus Megaera venefica]